MIFDDNIVIQISYIKTRINDIDCEQPLPYMSSSVNMLGMKNVLIARCIANNGFMSHRNMFFINNVARLIMGLSN